MSRFDSPALLGLAVLGGALVAYLPRMWREWRQKRIDAGKVPWARVRAVAAWGPAAGNVRHQVLGVSRHDIAECGLTCPACHSLVAERGDFSRVQRMSINGTENEVIECLNVREVENGRDVPCETFLAASPDTEHGDHLDANGNVDAVGDNDPPEYYRFVRVTKQKAAAEKYGADVFLLDGDDKESLAVDSDNAPTVRIERDPRVATTRKHDVLAGEELRAAIQHELDNQARTASTPPPETPLDPRLAETDKLPVVTLPPT